MNWPKNRPCQRHHRILSANPAQLCGRSTWPYSSSSDVIFGNTKIGGGRGKFLNDRERYLPEDGELGSDKKVMMKNNQPEVVT